MPIFLAKPPLMVKESRNTSHKLGAIADYLSNFVPKVKYYDGTVDRFVVNSVNFLDYPAPTKRSYSPAENFVYGMTRRM
jgi:hypothetical protein